ncbi:MAG: hypothetical protein HZB51_09060 [Chloroflexi bacterium]|nr:hypothetical protein [Chloroflexota bacterium]
MSKKLFVVLSLMAVLMLALTACGGGGSPVTINDVPVYTGATEFKAGDSRLGATLAQNSQQITALSQAAGAGGKTDQKGFALPKDATWDAVKKFYDDKLKSGGWSEPGGVAGNVLAQVNASNDAFQTATYTRGNQSLIVMRITEPVSKEIWLIFSLTTR